MNKVIAQVKENWEHIIYWVPWVFIPCTVWYNRYVDIQNSHYNGCTLTPANRNDDLNFLHILRKHGYDREYLFKLTYRLYYSLKTRWRSESPPLRFLHPYYISTFLFSDCYRNPEIVRFQIDWRTNIILNVRMTLTLYTLTSICIFSILLSIHFLMCWKRRICLTIKTFFSWLSFPLFSWP